MSSYSRPSTDYCDYFLWYCPSVYSDDSGDPPQIVCSAESQTPSPSSVYERIESSLERDLALLSVQNDMAPPTRSTTPRRSPSPPTTTPRRSPSPPTTTPTRLPPLPTFYDGKVQPRRLLCCCNIEPIFRTCYLNKNVGRRYFVCANTGTLRDCGFIHWIDEQLCDRGVEFALEVLEENKRLKKELELRDFIEFNRQKVCRN